MEHLTDDVRVVQLGLFTPAPGSNEVRLRISKCPACAHATFPAQEWCPACCDVSMEPTTTGPRGVLRGFTAVNHATPGSRVPAPYAVGTVDFPEGIRVVGLLTQPSIENLRMGQAVTTVARPAYEEDGTVLFTYGFQP